jgi:hypothetical protein
LPPPCNRQPNRAPCSWGRRRVRSPKTSSSEGRARTYPSAASPLSGSYLVGARPRPVAEAGRCRLAARAPLVGRGYEPVVLTDAVRAAVGGRGRAVVLVGEPGIGKTRLVAERRKFFMAGSGRRRGGCGCGWRAAVRLTPPLPRTGPTSSSCAGLYGYPWRPAMGCCAPPWNRPCA